MKHSRMLPILAIAFVGALGAQDAGLVLRTTVSYNTQKATLQLTDDQRRQADDLLRQAQQANQQAKYGEAVRSLYQGLAIMRKQEWSPAFEYISSLQAKFDHAIVPPDGRATLILTTLYPTPRAKDLKITAALTLAPSGSALGAPAPIDPAASAASVRVPFANVPAGDYTVEVRFSADGMASTPVLRAPVHVEVLTDAVAGLRTHLSKAPKRDGFATAEYALALFERADKGEISPARINFRQEFANADAMLDALEAGKDPFTGKKGDVHRAYRSQVDDTLQPYRLFIPSTYDASKPTPLVVALHGMGGDENTLFDSYGDGALKKEAERHGFLVACPKGRDSASMYRGTAEQDVMDVLAEVQRMYKVDPARIYMMGHSMGGYGTWSTAMDHPEIFAALGPISGGGSPAGMAKIKDIPEYVTHGDDDRTVPVTQSRNMVEAGRKAGAEITYVEVPGGSHVSVAVPSFAPMFDFFAKQKKQ